MEKYHLHLDNAQKGPFSLGQLQEMWKAGEINARTQFWTKANDEWRPIEEIISLLEPAKPAAPVHEAGGPSPLAATTAAKVAAMSAPEATDWRDRMADAAARDNPKPSGNRPLRKSFPMLSVLSALMRGVGWLVFLVGLVFVLMAVGDMLVKAGDTGKVPNIAGLYAGGMAVMCGMGLIMYGELVGVAFSIEENTFKTARSLDDIAQVLQQMNRERK